MTNLRKAQFALAAVIMAILATSAAAEELTCQPRADVARLLNERWGETSVFEGAGPNGVTLEIFARLDGTWTVVVVSPDGRTCPLAGGEVWRGFMMPQGEPG